MTERKWVKDVLTKRLEDAQREGALPNGLTLQPEQRLPYAFEIPSYSGDGQKGGVLSPRTDTKSYAIDLLIGEWTGAKSWNPRVAVEVKLQINTHSVITYSQKAADHRAVSPYLRYGMLAVGFATLPWRLLRHGSHFDFMIRCGTGLPDSELRDLADLVYQEVEASRRLEAVLYKSPKQKTTLLHRSLTLD
ncbi:MAG: hypothetical protein F4Z65_13640 [Acidobacteria bacterium]|nr:hypothetical protein [Acidobacteriota bacterium]MYA46767.1 hypothetical protein [Acidobacteriota bacterium]MYI39591.1 hypothetical protein [Acidobacteriota bacterium]